MSEAVLGRGIFVRLYALVGIADGEADVVFGQDIEEISFRQSVEDYALVLRIAREPAYQRVGDDALLYGLQLHLQGQVPLYGQAPGEYPDVLALFLEAEQSYASSRIDGYRQHIPQQKPFGMTLAPEAGSQRLRNLIKKNISEEQILHAVLTLYENGWSRVKFYFICGLPTETLEDMDEMAQLLSNIKYRCKQIKREKGLNHGLDITCTLSIFVPKPFTPFQWYAQMDLEKVREHIHYLKEKTSHIKGLKINYHEDTTSQIEAVLTRGDRNLCRYVEALYKKGCYLDAWGEYFNKDIWHETAEELGINLAQLAQKQYSTEENLPWDFINIGVDKEWLIKEYNDNSTPESVLILINKILDIYHQRGDLSSIFIEGGKKSLSLISNSTYENKKIMIGNDKFILLKEIFIKNNK